MKTHKFLKGRVTAILLALCMVATLLPVTALAAGTQITEVVITTTDSFPESFTAGMTITDEMLSKDNVTCSAGCTVSDVAWGYYRGNMYGDLTTNTVLQEGDTVTLYLFIDADDGYEFARGSQIGETVFYVFTGSIAFNGTGLPDAKLLELSNGGYELNASTSFNVGPAENPPAQSNRFEIALDNVTEGGVLTENLGVVQYAVVTEYAQTQINPVNMNVDYDGEADGVTLTVGNTGGDNPCVKYTYTVKDTTKQFKLYVIPAKGKTATITKDNQGTMEVVDKVSWKPGTAPNFTIKNVPADGFYRVEFSDTGSQPGGNTDGPDAAPSDDAGKLQFYDRFSNNFTYDEFKRADLGTVQYSYDQNTWYEFTAEQVAADEKLFWYTDKSDPEPANWKQIYYFNNEDALGVKLRVTEGDLSYRIDNGNSQNFEIGTGYNLLIQTYRTLSILPQDDGVRNITWSDDAEQSDQRVEHGKVIIEKAVIGEENAFITDGPYNQQGNKGYVGIKGGATVTVKLIPDYGYQVDSLSLNGQALTPQAEEATYTFTMPDTNLHLAAVFKEKSDEIKADAAGVTGGSITGGEKVIDSGNLRLSVIDSTMTDEQKAQMQNSAAAKDADILRYLEVDLEKFVNKGNSGEEWTEDLEELSEKIKITLNVGTDLDADKTYVVVREHEGVYEQIPATYDKTAGTLTFESDKFSDYALATVNTNAVTELEYTDVPLYFTDGMNVTDFEPANLAAGEGYRYFWGIGKYDKDGNFAAIYVPEEYIPTAAVYLGETENELRDYSIEFGDKFDKNYRYYFMGFAGLNDGYSFGNSVTFTATDVEGTTMTDILENTSSDNYVYWEQPLTAKGAEGGNTGNNGNNGNAGTTTPTDPSKPEETTPNTGNDPKSPQTGDNSNIALWFVLLFVSCGGVIGAAVYSKRKNGRQNNR